MFQEAISRWPDSDFIQARALFSIARTYDSEGKHQLAQNTYREVIDRFQAKNVPGIPQIVAQAKSRYFRVKEEPTAKLARGSNRFPIFGRLKPLDE
jgi:TolA-binding protein